MHCPSLAIFTLVLLVLSAPVAFAADNCASAETQAALDQCYGNAWKVSDKELNTLYRRIEARLKDDPDATKRLVSAQKAWLAFRDAECGFATSKSEDGSAYPMLQAICLMGLTEKRIADFKVYLSCQEGDMTCPVPAE